jgi:hypothetical protein
VQTKLFESSRDRETTLWGKAMAVLVPAAVQLEAADRSRVWGSSPPNPPCEGLSALPRQAVWRRQLEKAARRKWTAHVTFQALSSSPLSPQCLQFLATTPYLGPAYICSSTASFAFAAEALEHQRRRSHFNCFHGSQRRDVRLVCAAPRREWVSQRKLTMLVAINPPFHLCPPAS